MTNVLIGIQARSGSTRLPGKVYKPILGMPVIDHVIYGCRKSLIYINKYSHKSGINVELCVCIPEGDSLENYLKGKVDIVKGSENDLISRYKKAAEHYDADYIVRITSDCPLLPTHIISKAVNTCVRGNYDFVTDAHPKFRTHYDGSDVEICSRKMLDWLDENAKEREHVFAEINANPPKWARLGHIFGYVDLSAIKLSIDTEEDFERVKKQMESLRNKKKAWEELHGKQTAHNF